MTIRKIAKLSCNLLLREYKLNKNMVRYLFNYFLISTLRTNRGGTLITPFGYPLKLMVSYHPGYGNI